MEKLKLPIISFHETREIKVVLTKVDAIVIQHRLQKYSKATL